MNPVRIATIACGLLLIAAVALSIPLFEQALNTKPEVNKPKAPKEEAENEIQKYSSILQRKPNDFAALKNRALAYRLAGQHKLALRDCNRLIKKFPKNSHGYAQRAQVYADLRQYRLAAKDMTKAIDAK